MLVSVTFHSLVAFRVTSVNEAGVHRGGPRKRATIFLTRPLTRKFLSRFFYILCRLLMET